MLKNGTFMKVKYRKLFFAALLGWLVTLLGGMADSVIAGLFLDADAVSAVGLISPLTDIMYFLTILPAIGCAIMYSRTLGAFQVERSRKIAGMGALVALVLAVIMTVLMLVGKQAVLDFYGASGQVRVYASQYYTPLILMAFIDPILWQSYYFISYDGDENIELISDIVMSVSNAVLSVLLVQTMGVAGLAVGSVLSYALGFVVLLPHFFKKSNSIRFKLWFSWKDLLEMVKLSSALSLTYLYVGIVDVVFNKLIIVLFGEAFLPAYTVVNAVMNFAAALACSGSACGPLVSVAYGENNIAAVKRTMHLTNRFTLWYGLAFTIVMEILAPFWPGIYAITDPVVRQASIIVGRVVPLTYLVTAYIYTYLDYYPLVDRNIEGNLLSLGYMLIGPLVLACPLAAIAGFNAMSVGFALTPLFAVVIMVFYDLIRHRIRQLPTLLPETDETETHFDIYLTENSIVELRDQVGEFLTAQGVTGKQVNEAEVVVEEALLHIMHKNKKKVLCECAVLAGPGGFRIITKDNGTIFDLTADAENAASLRTFVLSGILQTAREASNTTTISFNRNTFVWQR